MYWRGDWRLAQDMQQAIMKLILSEKSKQFIKMHKKPPINPSFFSWHHIMYHTNEVNLYYCHFGEVSLFWVRMKRRMDKWMRVDQMQRIWGTVDDTRREVFLTTRRLKLNMDGLIHHRYCCLFYLSSSSDDCISCGACLIWKVSVKGFSVMSIALYAINNSLLHSNWFFWPLEFEIRSILMRFSE